MRLLVAIVATVLAVLSLLIAPAVFMPGFDWGWKVIFAFNAVMTPLMAADCWREWKRGY